jgi:hypothetical protein
LRMGLSEKLKEILSSVINGMGLLLHRLRSVKSRFYGS